jgi:hypothetical protein
LESSRASWVEEVRQALERSCEADCVTRGALLDAIESGVLPSASPEGGWLARKEGEMLALYVVAGRALATAKGRCIHRQGATGPGGGVDATVDVTRVAFREDARIECRIVRSERSHDGQITPERNFRWRFGSGGTDLLVDIAPDSEEPAKRAEAQQAQRFVHAVISALSESPARR